MPENTEVSGGAQLCYPTAQTGVAPAAGVSSDSGHALGTLRGHLTSPSTRLFFTNRGASASLSSWPWGPCCSGLHSMTSSRSA